MDFLFLFSPHLNMMALTLIRIGFGLLFIGHGFPKIFAGIEEWKWHGEQMANLGITFAPVFWGLCAILSEALGGLCLTLGLFTRVAASFMAFTMFVATIHHIVKGDSFAYTAYPVSQMVVFIALIVAGGGIYSLDYYFFK